MAVRTEYRPLPRWGRFIEPPSRGPIPRGSGAEDGGPPDLIGRVTVIVSPVGQVTAGTPVRFTAVRQGGSAPLTYQWSGPSGLIAGATGSAYTFTPTSPSDSGAYTVAVTSPGATDTPANAGATIVVVLADRWLMEDAGFILMEDSGDFLLET